MPQSFLSAEIVNATVVSIDKFLSAQDRALASAEMSMGTVLEVRDFECSFGGCWVEPSGTSNSLKPAIVGTGVFRKYSESAPSFTNLTSPYEIAFDYDVFLGNRPLSDVYAFGATYAVAYKTSGTPNIAINALPFRGGVTNEGSPLLVARTFDIPEAIALVDSEYMTDFVITDPGDDVHYVELQRFVISVENYIPASNGLTESKIYFVDKRVPRGWGGFADEISAAYFNPSTVSNWRTQSAIAEQVSTALYNFVSAWVDLTAWTPDFTSYWTTYTDDMPVRLKQYLLEELNIILP